MVTIRADRVCPPDAGSALRQMQFRSHADITNFSRALVLCQCVQRISSETAGAESVQL